MKTIWYQIIAMVFCVGLIAFILTYVGEQPPPECPEQVQAEEVEPEPEAESEPEWCPCYGFRTDPQTNEKCVFAKPGNPYPICFQTEEDKERDKIVESCNYGVDPPNCFRNAIEKCGLDGRWHVYEDCKEKHQACAYRPVCQDPTMGSYWAPLADLERR